MRAGAPPQKKQRHGHRRPIMDSIPPREAEDREPLDYPTPSADDSERQLLAAALRDGNLRQAEREGIVPGDFADHLNRRIFSAMRELERSAGPGGGFILDQLTEVLKKGEAGGEPSGVQARLSIIAGMEPLPPGVLTPYIAKMKEQATKRELVSYHLEAARRLQTGELDMGAHLTEAPDRFRAWSVLPSVEVTPVSARLDEIDQRLLSEGTKPVPTFSAMLNKNLNGGLQRKKVLTIVAPAGAGKTTFALQLLEETARAHQSDTSTCVGVYVSMEMAAEELVTKSYSRLGLLNSGRIEGKTIKEDTPEMEKLAAAMKLYREKYADFVYIVEAPAGMKIDAVKWLTRKIKTQLERIAGEVFLILCVDPFQRLRTGDREIDADETARVGELASGLKKLARDEDISVVLLSDTTKAATENAEEGLAGGATAPRGSYMITHVTDLLAELRVIGAKAKEGKGKTTKGTPADAYRASFEADLPLGDCGYGSLPTYAVLDFSKNRSGSVKDCRFVWQKAYNRFIPIGREQLGLDGGKEGEWRARWRIEAGDDAVEGVDE